jgi:hypothetical protein
LADQFDKANWPFALEHAIWESLTSNCPRTDTGEIFTRNQIYGSQFPTTMSSLGSPCYVLDHSLTRWKANTEIYKRSRLGMYMGLSNQHSSSVGQSSNLQTGNANHPSTTTSNLLLYTEPFQKNSLTLKSGIRSSNLTHTG